jgi:hypothetical protein
MKQSIATRYMGSTNTRGSRIKATSASGHTLTLPWNDEHTSDANHVHAAFTLASKLEWRGKWHAGSTKDGCVFVLEDDGGFTV